jgi:predicted nuclease of restriction endonuclease-like (RecB) superfamily
MMTTALTPQLVNDIRALLAASRHQLQTAVNSAMVLTYWQVGRLIVEDEQAGAARAEYGTQQMKLLAAQLSSEFGSGFDATNLRNMRQFYLTYPIRDAVRRELSWTHYRSLIRIESQQAREWYATEAIASRWSARALDRQISVLYYERLLSSREPAPVRVEADEKTAPLQLEAKQILRDPCILDLLNLPSQSAHESTVEQGLMDNLQHFLLELGRGFAFVARQQRLSVDGEDFYLDVVFYNFRLKCFCWWI